MHKKNQEKKSAQNFSAKNNVVHKKNPRKKKCTRKISETKVHKKIQEKNSAQKKLDWK